MNADASEARNSAGPVISCSSPQRPMGILETKAAYCCGLLSRGLFMSVPKGPGQRALTVTPLVAHSRASTRVRPSNPVLEELYGVRPAIPMFERIDPR